MDYLDDVYNPTMMLTHERTVTDIDNDKRFQNMFLEIEYIIENVFAKNRRE